MIEGTKTPQVRKRVAGGGKGVTNYQVLCKHRASKLIGLCLAKLTAPTCKFREFSKEAANCLDHKTSPTSSNLVWQRATGEKPFLANLPAHRLNNIHTNNGIQELWRHMPPVWFFLSTIHILSMLLLIKYVHIHCPTQPSCCLLIREWFTNLQSYA